MRDHYEYGGAVVYSGALGAIEVGNKLLNVFEDILGKFPR
jgi:hypothetical protein